MYSLASLDHLRTDQNTFNFIRFLYMHSFQLKIINCVQHEKDITPDKKNTKKIKSSLNFEAYVRPVSTAYHDHFTFFKLVIKWFIFLKLFFDILLSALIQYLPLRKQKPRHNIAATVRDAGGMTFGALRHVPYCHAHFDTVHVNYLF